MNRNRPRISNITFGDSPGNRMASGSNHNAKIGGDCRRYQQYGYNNEDQDESDRSDIYHPHMVHSIHRNRRYTSQDDIRRTQSVRLGGTFGRTLHRRGQESSSHNIIEEHADLIVAKMERDPTLMEDSPASEDLRREALRDMPQCLRLKRCVKVKLVKSVSKKSKSRPIGCFKRFKYRASFGLSRLRTSFKNLLYSMELWYGALKQIEGNFGSGIGSYFKFLRRIFILNLFVAIVSFIFIVLPQLLCSQNNERTEFEEFKFEHIFTGEGYFRNSLLYYGFYTNRTLSFGSLPYHMPYAYFFTMACIYMICLAFFSISAARSYSKSFIKTEDGLKNVFANKIFCGWDYSIATKDAAQLKCHSIYNELREILAECLKAKKQRSCLELFYTKIIQIMVNILVITALAAAGYVMWFFMKESFNKGWTPICTAVVVNAIMTVFPIIFSWIVQYEDYGSPSKNMYITLIRTFILGFVTIGVLLGFWLKDPSNTNNASSDCWETSLGVEIYRLILFDFIFSVIIIPILGVLTYAISRYFRKSCLHFDISAHTMQIIYNQSLFWMGLFFSPLLPIIVTIKIFIVWYIRQGFLLKFCKPSTKTWRAAQNSTWFLMMALLGLLLVIGLLGYIISDIRTTDCGPCRHYDYIYEIITLGILNLRTHNTVFRILLFTTKPGFIALVLIALCGRVYYMRSKAHSLRRVVTLYREMLVWESRDKEFLLQNLSDITEGKWQYRIQDFRKMDPIVSSPFVSEFETEQSRDTGHNLVTESSSGNLLRTTPSTSISGPSSYTESDIDDHFSSYKKYP